ncbi:hypothetical protein PIB30_041996 [Stylosanthes scabra]|uniref:Uncharacterized protein n=1 Tax=Stylosanthes scabra TaxID=79078 RepID=A0ABU6QEI6_9FABA|nr:hypothetical protein [Stylosanthes scabra]
MWVSRATKVIAHLETGQFGSDSITRELDGFGLSGHGFWLVARDGLSRICSARLFDTSTFLKSNGLGRSSELRSIGNDIDEMRPHIYLRMILRDIEFGAATTTLPKKLLSCYREIFGVGGGGGGLIGSLIPILEFPELNKERSEIDEVRQRGDKKKTLVVDTARLDCGWQRLFRKE